METQTPSRVIRLTTCWQTSFGFVRQVKVFSAADFNTCDCHERVLEPCVKIPYLHFLRCQIDLNSSIGLGLKANMLSSAWYNNTKYYYYYLRGSWCSSEPQTAWISPVSSVVIRNRHSSRLSLLWFVSPGGLCGVELSVGTYAEPYCAWDFNELRYKYMGGI